MAEPQHFLAQIIAQHKAEGRYGGRVVTRFPPEPNGYLHIGHSKSISLNFGLAAQFGGVCHLRYDDTNPETEEQEYVSSILEAVNWLGFDPGDKVFYASDYFGQLFDYANLLIRKGLAYVCELTEEETRAYRGTVTEPGRPSPFRERSVADNLDLFARMQAGEFPEGKMVLRAKIDMASPNMKMRDPLLYRIKFASHYRTGTRWKVYPFYDFAHCLSDAIEKITHSICTLEFENNRELYDWIVEACEIVDPPRQYEFARLNLTWTVMSKRRFIQLVEQKLVDGWDDPRMPTLFGLRRRGVTPSALRSFCDRVGVAKANSVVEVELLENTIRDDLNPVAPRAMAVLRPLKFTLTNWPAGRVEQIDAPLYPPESGRSESRQLALGSHVYIESTDFAEVPPPGWKRLVPGSEVRLRHGPVVRCDEVVRDGDRVVELRGRVDLDTLGGRAPEGRKVKGIVHWVGHDAVPVEARLYDRLIRVEFPTAENFMEELNPRSLEVLSALGEPLLAGAAGHFQFERTGYFFRDPTFADRPVYNRVVGLKEGYAVEDRKPEAEARKPEVPQVVGQARALDDAAESRRVALVARGVTEAAARTLAVDEALVTLFEQVAALSRPEVAANFVANVVLGEARAAGVEIAALDGARVGRVVALLEAGTLGQPQAKRVLAAVVREGADPDEVVRREGLSKVTDPAVLGPMVDAVVSRHTSEAERYRAGQVQLLGFFVGQVLKQSGGKADAAVVNELLRARLG